MKILNLKYLHNNEEKLLKLFTLLCRVSFSVFDIFILWKLRIIRSIGGNEGALKSSVWKG